MAEFTTVFLSSTAKDLQPWRDAVHAAIGKMAGLHCVRMEDFGAVDAAPADLCRRKVAECDLFVGLVGHFWGSQPEGSALSYTQLEYAEATERRKPRLLFVADDDFPLSPRLGREPDEAYRAQLAFREQVQRERAIVRFHDPDQLATQVATALGNHLDEMRREAAQRAADAARLPSGSDIGGRPSEPAGAGGNALAMGDGAVAAASGGIAGGRDVTVSHIGTQIVQGAPPSGPDGSALRQAYLRQLIGKLENLVLSGVDPAVKDARQDPRLKLRAIYTALRTATRDGDPAGFEKGGRPGREALEERRFLSALEVLDREDRLVLLGGPGSGKSTFVSFVALCLAGEALGHSDLNLATLNGAEAVLAEESDEEPSDLEEGEAGDETAATSGSAPRAKRSAAPRRKAGWSHGPLLPVRIVLRDFAAKGHLPPRGETATARSLADFLRRELEEDFDLPDFEPILCQELYAGRCLVLLDGLDEVPEAEERREQIVQAVEAWTQKMGPGRVLVTSRTYAYQNEAWKLRGFAEATLTPFDQRQIEHFVALWYGQMVSLGRCAAPEAEVRREQLTSAIFASERLMALAEQPLLLTLTASLHAWRRGELPRRREVLYRDAVELLLETWERRQELDSRGRPLEAQPGLAELLRVGPEEVRLALNELAYEAHAAQPGQAGTADLDGDRLVARLFKLNRNPEFNAGQLLAYLRDRAGLLVERGTNVFTFPHRTFQEYLAACHLTQASVPEDIADLARADPGRWREVLLLSAAELAAVSNLVWQLAEALCPLDEEGAELGEEDRWGALLAAQVVVECADRRWLEEPESGVGLGGDGEKVGKGHQRRVAHLREWLDHLRWRAVDVMRTASIPVLERARAGKLLAELGDPRFDAAHWGLPKGPELGFVEVPTGSFWMGSAEGEPNSFDVERPRHEVESFPAFWLARYPVTVGQFAAFVDQSEYKMPDERWRQGPSNQPVAYVSWSDALAYCAWLEERLRSLAERVDGWPAGAPAWWGELAACRLRVSLPSEAEWEKAARGVEGLIYPWGDEPDPNRANYDDTGLGERSAVGCFAAGCSPFGHEEMSGNVWEWTRSLWGEDWHKPQLGYPDLSGGEHEDIEESPQVRRVARGGAFSDFSKFVRCAFRYRDFPAYRNVLIGFRVVLSPFPP